MSKKLPVVLALAVLPFAGPARAAALELRFTSGAFRPESSAAEAMPIDASATGHRFLVAITRAPLGPAERRQIEEAGAEILDYVPVNGYRLRVPPESESSLRALPAIAWLGAVPARFKVAPEIASDAETGAKREVSVRIVLEAGEPAGRVLEATK